MLYLNVLNSFSLVTKNSFLPIKRIKIIIGTLTIKNYNVFDKNELPFFSYYLNFFD